MASAAKKRARTQKDDVEHRLQEACKSLQSNVHKSYSSAAEAFEVNYHTLRNRYLGLTRRPVEAHEVQQLLNNAQEKVLADWLVYLGHTGHAVSKCTIGPKVEALCGRTPSKTWLKGFLEQHPDLVLGRPTGLDPKRAQAFNFPTTDHHFKLLKSFIDEHRIPWENIYNMDEKGLQLGGGRKAGREKLFFSRSQSANLQLVTVIECVSADGGNILPGFVFPGVEQCPEWSEGTDKRIIIATSENGWTSDYICTEWFAKGFIPQVKARNISKKPILLIYDGHGSHEADGMRELALEHGIHLFCLPPHTTHRLQPLNVGVFGPLQREWKKCCITFLEDKNRELALKDVVHVYLVARNHAFKVDTILSTWQKSGIHPINPQVFSDEDFAPSHATLRLANVPSSYPTIMPSFSDDPSSDSSDDTFIPWDNSDTSSDDDLDNFSNKLDNSSTCDEGMAGEDLRKDSCASLEDSDDGNDGDGNKNHEHKDEHEREDEHDHNHECDHNHERNHEHNHEHNHNHKHYRDKKDSGGTGRSGDDGGGNSGGDDSSSDGGGDSSNSDGGGDSDGRDGSGDGSGGDGGGDNSSGDDDSGDDGLGGRKDGEDSKEGLDRLEILHRHGAYAALSRSDSERAEDYSVMPSHSNSSRWRTHSMTSALSTPSSTAFALPPSPYPSQSSSRQTRDQLEIQHLQNILRQRKFEMSEMAIQLNASKAHCALMKRHFGVVQHQLNLKTHTQGERHFNTTSRVLTSAEAQAEWQLAKTARTAKEAKKQEDEKKKKDAARDCEARRAVTSTVFSGGLKTKAKEELGDIASALGLLVEGTNKVIIEHIQTHLDAMPSLADDPRFAGLFARRTRGCKHAARDFERMQPPLDDTQMARGPSVSHESERPSQSKSPPPALANIPLPESVPLPWQSYSMTPEAGPSRHPNSMPFPYSYPPFDHSY
ncbi:hypothetical protein HETIRDRAFT_419178 [Heterobasidion irregulare TC 32-1]|uniref:HTH CENPB-type domain-containing protein n=1 Tax=Heterobasidion irregulare (strain TC 32-1) TaxID=747525 RepID=W4K265_HETIT|nr:uncharacterized protein HETIRDRAFT_419178 [Heterobasidion irregulare TC 32-1]ETW79440.1 hypothetical protein HETIRDRAFT_419178 [Heterobasidion irregulare TC 32-1]